MKGIPNMKKSELIAIIRECLDEALTPIEKEQGLLRNMHRKSGGIKAKRTLAKVAANPQEPKTNYQNLKTIKKTYNKHPNRGAKPKGGY